MISLGKFWRGFYLKTKHCKIIKFSAVGSSCSIPTFDNWWARTKHLCESLLETWPYKSNKTQDKSRSQKLLPQLHGDGKRVEEKKKERERDLVKRTAFHRIIREFFFLILFLFPLLQKLSQLQSFSCSNILYVGLFCSSNTACHWISFKVVCFRSPCGLMTLSRRMNFWVVFSWIWVEWIWGRKS